MVAEKRKLKTLHDLNRSGPQTQNEMRHMKQIRTRGVVRTGDYRQKEGRAKLTVGNKGVVTAKGRRSKSSKTTTSSKENTGKMDSSKNSCTANHEELRGIRHMKGKVKTKKQSFKTECKGIDDSSVEKLKVLMKLEKKGKFKKPLTDRQKHKLLKLRMRRKAKKAGKSVTQAAAVKESKTQELSSDEHLNIPKTTQEVSSNWKKLQETSFKNKAMLDSRKRKLSPDKIRNPKYRKLDAQPSTAPKKPDIWFDDVDEFLIEGTSEAISTGEEPPGTKNPNPLVKPEAFKGLTKAMAMDCEMVGVGDGTDSMVARVSIVNQHGEPVYDKYVKPKERVVDYRTHVSGIRPGDLDKGEDLQKVQKDVADIIKGRILVGHAIQNDLQVLFLQHPRKKIRDTSRYKAFRRLFQGRTPSLKNLSSMVLHVQVQEGEHNSIQDAQAAMRLYTMFRKQWESELKLKRMQGRGKVKTKT